MSKPNNESKRDGPAGGGGRRSGPSGNHNRNNGQQESRRPRGIIIPEARVIQAYNECAYISDYEEDERECLPLPIRRSGEVVRYSLQEEIRHHQVEEVKNDSSSTFSKTDVGDRQQRNTRCLCFDCWAGPK
jgi:hypothetical protein